MTTTFDKLKQAVAAKSNDIEKCISLENQLASFMKTLTEIVPIEIMRMPYNRFKLMFDINEDGEESEEPVVCHVAVGGDYNAPILYITMEDTDLTSPIVSIMYGMCWVKGSTMTKEICVRHNVRCDNPVSVESRITHILELTVVDFEVIADGIAIEISKEPDTE